MRDRYIYERDTQYRVFVFFYNELNIVRRDYLRVRFCRRRVSARPESGARVKPLTSKTLERERRVRKNNAARATFIPPRAFLRNKRKRAREFSAGISGCVCGSPHCAMP